METNTNVSKKKKGNKEMRKVFNFGFWMAVIILTFCFAAMPVEAATTEYENEAHEALEDEGLKVYGWEHYDDSTRFEISGVEDQVYMVGWVLVENELDEYGDLTIIAGDVEYYNETGRHDLVWVPDEEAWVEYIGGVRTSITDW